MRLMRKVIFIFCIFLCRKYMRYIMMTCNVLLNDTIFYIDKYVDTINNFSFKIFKIIWKLFCIMFY